MREIKFRAWHKTVEAMFYPDYEGEFSGVVDGERVCSNFDYTDLLQTECIVPYIPMQYTGLKDKNGKEIYEGDVVRYNHIEIVYQTHTGDNILGGSYTEPCGIKAVVIDKEVLFHNGEFTVVAPNADDEEPPSELNWLRYPERLDRETLNYIFFPHYDSSRSQKYSDEEFIETMGYVCQDLGITATSIEEFISKVNGVEIIGNIYENPELLKS